MHCDYNLRCVRMCAINLALRNLSGYVIHGNSLTDERRLVYRIGFDLKGFISEMPIDECPEPVQKIAVQQLVPSADQAPRASGGEPSSADHRDDEPPAPGKQLVLF